MSQQLIDQIIAANAVRRAEELGASVRRELRGSVSRFRRTSASNSHGEFRAMAERQIRRDLVIETIAEKEGLAATEKDLDDRIAEQAEKRGSESRRRSTRSWRRADD